MLKEHVFAVCLLIINLLLDRDDKDKTYCPSIAHWIAVAGLQPGAQRR
jgi:hypothetical protein